MISKCALCGSNISRFIKKQEAKGPLLNLGLGTPLSKEPFLGDILFNSIKTEWNSKQVFVGDIFMHEMHLKQPGYTYSACGSFQERKKEKNRKETGDTNYIYKNELD